MSNAPPEVGLRGHTLTKGSLTFWFQRHQEYLKMLAEREEALGKSHPCPDLEDSQWAWVSLSPSGWEGRGVRAAQKLTSLALRVWVVIWGPGWSSGTSKCEWIRDQEETQTSW